MLGSTSSTWATKLTARQDLVGSRVKFPDRGLLPPLLDRLQVEADDPLSQVPVDDAGADPVDEEESPSRSSTTSASL